MPEISIDTQIESHVVQLIKILYDFVLDFVILLLYLKMINDVIIVQVLNRGISRQILRAILVIDPHLSHLDLFLLALTFPHIYLVHCCLHELGHFTICRGKVLELNANSSHIT